MAGVQRGLSAETEEGYPRYIRAAFGVTRDWMSEAACSQEFRNGSEQWWWTIRKGERRAGLPGEKWIELAEQICSRCSVQWDCVVHAYEVGEYNTWAMSEEHRQELYKMSGWQRVIEAARATETPVRVAFVRMRESRYGNTP